jgi:hypothetical protein
MLERKQKLDSIKAEELIAENHLEVELSTDIYTIQLDKVIEERCDELDYILEDNGYDIIHRDMRPVATSIFNYTIYFIEGRA